MVDPLVALWNGGDLPERTPNSNSNSDPIMGKTQTPKSSLPDEDEDDELPGTPGTPRASELSTLTYSDVRKHEMLKRESSGVQNHSHIGILNVD